MQPRKVYNIISSSGLQLHVVKRVHSSSLVHLQIIMMVVVQTVPVVKSKSL